MWILPYYIKTYQHDYYSTHLCFDSMLSYNTSVQNNIVMTTAKQNQKFPFHSFRFAVEGWGEETREKCKEIFWFLHTRVRERVRGALVRITTQSARTIQSRATTRPARAHHWSFRSKKVRAKASISPQNETSESERWEEARAKGAGVGKRCRRFATNWDGTGISKRADLSLVSSLKTNL